MTARGLVGVLAIAVALAVAPAAQAHIHSGLAAVDYRGRAFPLGGLRQALTISIYKTDLIRGTPNARALAAGGLGVLALAVGLGKLPVLLHGVVLAAIPATATRLAVSVAIWAGAAAPALGLVAFFEVLDEPQSAPTVDERPRAWERALD